MITVEPALPARCAFVLLQWLDPSLPLPTSETRCGLSNSTTLFFTGDSFVSLTPHLDIENRGKPRVTVRRVTMGHQYHCDTTSILCPFFIMSPHLCLSPVITWVEPSFWEDLFFERSLYCAINHNLSTHCGSQLMQSSFTSNPILPLAIGHLVDTTDC